MADVHTPKQPSRSLHTFCSLTVIWLSQKKFLSFLSQRICMDNQIESPRLIKISKFDWGASGPRVGEIFPKWGISTLLYLLGKQRKKSALAIRQAKRMCFAPVHV